MTSSSDILRRAAEVLGEKGWTQGQSMDNEGRMCAVGAIRYAGHEMLGGSMWGHRFDEAGAAVDVFFAHLNSGLKPQHIVPGDVPISIPEWNDNPERTAEDVILELKRAASESDVSNSTS